MTAEIAAPPVSMTPGPIAPVEPLADASARAIDLIDTGAAMEAEALERTIFSLIAAKRHEGQSFLGDFTAALLDHGVKAQAQLFQDVFAAFITRFQTGGYFVEIGTGDGKLISNTYFLEKQLGWNGLVVEPNPAFGPALARNRSCTVSHDCVFDITGRKVKFLCTADPEFSRVRGEATDLHDLKRQEFQEIELTTVSLNDLLKRNNCPPVINYLSIDVEGAEFDILQTFDFDSVQIDCLTVEHNWSYGQALVHDLLADHGFVRVFEHFSQWDDWYVRRDLLATFPAARDLLPGDADAPPGPDVADLFLSRAQDALDRGESDVAEALCARALEIDPQSGAGYRMMAAIAVIQGRRKVAVERWRVAVKRDPQDYWARIGLAEVLSLRGEIAEAVDHLKDALAIGDHAGRASASLAKLASKVGRAP